MAYGYKKDNAGRVVRGVFRAGSSFAANQRKIDRMATREKISHFKCEVWAAFIVTILIAFSGIKGGFYWFCLFVGTVYTLSAINKLVDSGYK